MGSKDIIDVNYEIKKDFKFNIIGILDFNQHLLIVYSSNTLYLISKENFEIISEINEYKLIYLNRFF